MGEAIFTAGHRGQVKIYRWKMYNANSTTTYTWNKWNAVSTTTYYWNKYSTDTKYTWNKWGLTITYQWNKWDAVQGYTISKAAAPANTIVYAEADLCWTPGECTPRYVKTQYTSPAYAWGFYIYLDSTGRTTRQHIKNGTLNGRAVPYGKCWYHWSGSAPWDISEMLGILDGNYISGNSDDRDRFYLKQIWSLSDSWSKGTTSSGTVKSTNASAYPNGGRHTDGYWYDGRTTLYSKGSYVGTVTATNNANAYPNGSWSGSNWYDGRTSALIKGTTSYGQVSSTNSSAYPSPGASGSYWYESAGSSVSWSKGSTLQGTVKSTNASAYPNGGRDGNFWYDGRTSSVSWSMGTYIQDVVSTDRKAYPDNDRVGAYWYVYQGES